MDPTVEYTHQPGQKIQLIKGISFWTQNDGNVPTDYVHWHGHLSVCCSTLSSLCQVTSITFSSCLLDWLSTQELVPGNQSLMLLAGPTDNGTTPLYSQIPPPWSSPFMSGLCICAGWLVVHVPPSGARPHYHSHIVLAHPHISISYHLLLVQMASTPDNCESMILPWSHCGHTKVYIVL